MELKKMVNPFTAAIAAVVFAIVSLAYVCWVNRKNKEQKTA